MEPIKQEILEILAANARTSHQKMAVMLGVEEAVVTQAVAEMEKDGVIVQYTTRINRDRTEDESIVDALIEVRVSPQRDRGFNTIARRIYQFDEVGSVYLMSGGFDLMVMVSGRSMREVAFFVAEKLSTIDGVLSTATHFVLKKYKDNGLVLDDDGDDRLIVHP